MYSYGQERRRDEGPTSDSSRRSQRAVGLNADWLMRIQRLASGGREAQESVDHARTRAPVSAAARAVAVQRVEEEQPSASAPAPAPVSVRQLDLGNEIPGYWDDLAWDAEGDGNYRADLPSQHPVFQQIAEYARLSQKLAPYTSQTGENTRMTAVTKDLADPQKAAAKPVLEQRLREGKKGGPPAPKSGSIRITRIRVLANPELWKKYNANRKEFQRSLSVKGKNGFTVGKDYSDKIKWSTGKRPNLGNTADTKQLLNDLPTSGSLMPPADAGEAFLFHGTGTGAMDLIQKGGFDPKRGNKGTDDKPRFGPLGQGVYMADNMSKAQTYARCDEPTCQDYDCKNPAHPPSQMLLSRALVGHPSTAHFYDHSRRQDDHTTMKEGRHSIHSPSFKQMGATGGNEYLFKNASHLYPEFRVYYHLV